jgi:hypothetical protein
MDDEFKSMVRRVKDNHQFTMLLLSTNPVPGNREEPLSYVMRRLMIHEAFPELFIAPLMDMASTKKWVSMLEGKIRESFPLMSARIYAAPEIPLVPEHRHLWDRLQAARNMVYEQYTTAKRAAEARRKLASVVTAIPDEDVPF